MNDAIVLYERELPEAVSDLSAEELLSAAFSHWRTGGRGWTLFDFSVELEPPFCPFYHLTSAPEPPVFDDGRQATFWSRLTDGASGKPAADHSSALISYRRQLAEYYKTISEAFEPIPSRNSDAEFVELQLVLPKDLRTVKTVAENLLASFSYLSCPVAFEIIGTSQTIVIQFACIEADAARIRNQIKAHLPDAVIKETAGFLFDAWFDAGAKSAIVEFGLSNEFFLPLKTKSSADTDLFVSVVGALSDLKDNEVAVFQVLFQKTRNEWAQDTINAVGYLTETGAYAKTSGALHSAKEKFRTPLYAVCLRIACGSRSEQRNWQTVKALGAGVTALADPTGNELIPLSNDDYPEEKREEALIERKTFRSGMLLNLEELACLVHPPSSAVRSEKLQRESERTKAAPALALHNALVLGENFHQNELSEVSLSDEQRTKHIHLIGASGSGKSTLMLNLIAQDLERGQGLCVIDPHGDLIDVVMENIPGSRIEDVVLFDPSDAEYPIGFNILEAKSEAEKTLLASDLTATFRRLSTSWGDVMDAVLSNAVLAVLESERGGNLFDLKRFLVEKDFRLKFLDGVRDDAVRYFWLNEFSLLGGKSPSSILIRLDTFLRQKIVRNIVCQKNTPFNFREIMDERKILLVKLAQGAIGEENSHLLGTLLVSKLYQTALSRQDTTARPFFSCYLDEFHHFITPSMEGVLSGVRKYNLGLVLAHQEFRQLQSRSPEVAASVLSNCYTRICFRLGDADAERFAAGFSFFDADNLQNLSVGEAVGRIERAEFDFNLKTAPLPKIVSKVAAERRARLVASSRERYAQKRAVVEAAFSFVRAVESSSPVTAPKAERKTPSSPAPIVSAPAVKQNSASEIVEKNIPSAPPPTAEPVVSSASLPLPKAAAFDKDTQGHRYLQSLVKRMAESRGFLATIEKEVFGGIGKIDVALESETERIACEISVTNEAAYELQNIRKCLAANFAPVVVVSSDRRHLDKIKRLATENLTTDELGLTEYLMPEEFHVWLENRSAANSGSGEKVKGFKVNVKLKAVDDTDVSTRKRAISDVIFGGLKKLKKRFDD